jgi:hypothetical protein
MNCTKDGCAGQLRVTHTYTVSITKYQRAECQACGLVHTLQTVAEPTGARGSGAKARAHRAAQALEQK